MSDKCSGGEFAIGLLIGAAVGLAVGFLYAPRPGVETRAMLKERTEQLREKASEVAEKVKEKAHTKIEEMKGHTA